MAWTTPVPTHYLPHLAPKRPGQENCQVELEFHEGDGVSRKQSVRIHVPRGPLAEGTWQPSLRKCRKLVRLHFTYSLESGQESGK